MQVHSTHLDERMGFSYSKLREERASTYYDFKKFSHKLSDGPMGPIFAKLNEIDSNPVLCYCNKTIKSHCKL